MIIVISGCFGFIGQNLSGYLSERGHSIIGIYRKSMPVNRLIGDNITYIQCDLSVQLPIVDEFDLIINCAGNIGLRKIDIFTPRDLETDVDILARLISLVHNVNPCAKLLHFGTVDEYGQLDGLLDESRECKPVSVYGRSKLAATTYLLREVGESSLKAMIIRPSIVYGPGQNKEMFVASLLQSLMSNCEFKMTEGGQTRNFIHVHDLCNLVELLIQDFRCGEIVNAAFSESYTLKDVAIAIATNVNKLEFLRIGEVDYRSNEIMNYSPTSTKAKELYGFLPQYDVLNYPNP